MARIGAWNGLPHTSGPQKSVLPHVRWIERELSLTVGSLMSTPGERQKTFEHLLVLPQTKCRGKLYGDLSHTWKQRHSLKMLIISSSVWSIFGLPPTFIRQRCILSTSIMMRRMRFSCRRRLALRNATSSDPATQMSHVSMSNTAEGKINHWWTDLRRRDAIGRQLCGMGQARRE